MTAQAWGCFVLAIANFAQVATKFASSADQESVVRGMVVGVAPLFCLYGYRTFQGQLPVKGVAFILMAGCQFAFVTALLLVPRSPSATKKKMQS
jgi:hypothetical protein